MTVAFRSGETESVGPPFVPDEPAGAAVGDFMLVYGIIKSIDGSWSLPADFISIDEFSETTGTDSQVFIAYKIRGSDAGNGYSFGYSGTDENARVLLAAYSGSKLGLDVVYSKSSHYSTTENARNTAAKPIVTNTANAIVALCYMAADSAIDTFGPPTNYNQQIAAAGLNANIYLCDDNIVNAGTETPGVFTHADADETQDQRTFTIAIAELSTSKLAVFRRIRGY